MSPVGERTAEELWGKWMPRKKTTCARRPGHGGFCATAENMDHRRDYRSGHPHRQTPESRKKSARKSRLAAYGLTQKKFDQLLEAQGHACGMCHQPFADGQLIHVDHDHSCCPDDCRSCGKCVRGLLCHACNVALGHIEHRYALARAYLSNSPLWETVPPGPRPRPSGRRSPRARRRSTPDFIYLTADKNRPELLLDQVHGRLPGHKGQASAASRPSKRTCATPSGLPAHSA